MSAFAARYARALADVTFRAAHTRMLVRLPGGELRMHRFVTGLAAELWRLHPVQRAVPGEEEDHQVDGGQGDDRQRNAADP